MKKVLVTILTGVLLVGGVSFQAKADTTKFQDLKNEVIQADGGIVQTQKIRLIIKVSGNLLMETGTCLTLMGGVLQDGYTIRLTKKSMMYGIT